MTSIGQPKPLCFLDVWPVSQLCILCVCVCVCVYIYIYLKKILSLSLYIYIYIYTEREREFFCWFNAIKELF